MTSGTPRALAGSLVAWVLAAFLVFGCSTSATPSPMSVGPVTSPMTGVPIDIEAEGFTTVTAFTIRTDAGAQQRFLMGTLENGAAFPPNHLSEHLAASTQVRVFFRREGSDLVAYRLEDFTP